jgi:very-short-patch-repair endonuclease
LNRRTGRRIAYGECGNYGQTRRCGRATLAPYSRHAEADMRRVFTIARRLRKAATDAEIKLWSGLRGRQLDGFKFRRHFPIGGFIVDFACVEARLVIELDGGQHWDLAAHVAVRSQKLELCGYRVVRFWNHAVLLHGEQVLAEVRRQTRAAACGSALAALAARPLPPAPGPTAPFDFDGGGKGWDEPVREGALSVRNRRARDAL